MLIKGQASAASPHLHWTRWLREALSWGGGEDANPVSAVGLLPAPPSQCTPGPDSIGHRLHCVKGRHSRFLKITGEALSSIAGKLRSLPHQLHTPTEELMKLHV